MGVSLRQYWVLLHHNDGHHTNNDNADLLMVSLRRALFNPETSFLIQKRHLYTGNLNSETPGDSRNTFLH